MGIERSDMLRKSNFEICENNLQDLNIIKIKIQISVTSQRMICDLVNMIIGVKRMNISVLRKFNVGIFI